MRRSSSSRTMRATSLSIEHSGPSENVSTRKDAASASTAGRTYCQGPGMPGTSTSAGPLPCSMNGRISIPQRFARLERVLDALKGLSLAAELEERLALEIQQLLLADGGLVRERSAGETPRQRPADQRVVIADAARAPRQVDTQFQRGQKAVAADRNRRPRLWPAVALTYAFERDRLGVGHDALTVHRDGVHRPQKADARGVGSARRDPGEADGLENALHIRQEIRARIRQP